jgi:hypothetical protein
VQEVQTRARERGKDHVASDDHLFGRRGTPGDAEAARPLALVHRTAAHERGVLGVLRNHRARQRSGVLERASHDTRVVDAVAVVAEHPHPEPVELAHRRELMTGAALRDAAGRHHHARRARSRREDGGNHGRVVERRGGVRHRDDRREPAARRGARSGLHRFRFLHTRLAQVHVEIDEAGRHEAAGPVEGLVAREAGTDGDDTTAAHEDVGLALPRRVEHATALDDQIRQPGLHSLAGCTGLPCGPRRRS